MRDWKNYTFSWLKKKDSNLVQMSKVTNYRYCISDKKKKNQPFLANVDSSLYCDDNIILSNKRQSTRISTQFCF